jgi:two-component system chemotaxis response regulator CheB
MEKNPIRERTSLLVIGGSAGSFPMLSAILSALSGLCFVPVIVVIHHKDGSLTEMLHSKTSLYVKEAEEKEEIRSDTVYLAPPDYHLLIEKTHTFSLDASEKLHFSRPSIDATFESAAEAYGKQMVSILLSGANSDGVNGLRAVRQSGGLVIIQDPASAEMPFMPQEGIRQVGADIILNVMNIPDLVKRITS